VLHIHELPVVMVKPQRARYFARALGQRAKTDAIDAAVLAQMAVMAVDNVPLWTAPTADQAELRALHKRRAQLVEILGAEKKRLGHAEAVVRGSFEAVIQMLESQKKEIGHRMEELVAASAQLAPKIRAMTQVCGVGFQTAAALLARVPELGTLDRRQVAALIGVAPITRQSGSWSGYAYTGGGRAEARKALYMAALAARRHNSHIRSFYEGLVDRGKPKKVALVACMRKLAIHLNSILRRQAGQNA
jgi:transposase